MAQVITEDQVVETGGATEQEATDMIASAICQLRIRIHDGHSGVHDTLAVLKEFEGGNTGVIVCTLVDK